jgi:hypothetical protein
MLPHDLGSHSHHLLIAPQYERLVPFDGQAQCILKLRNDPTTSISKRGYTLQLGSLHHLQCDVVNEYREPVHRGRVELLEHSD